MPVPVALSGTVAQPAGPPQAASARPEFTSSGHSRPGRSHNNFKFAVPLPVVTADSEAELKQRRPPGPGAAAFKFLRLGVADFDTYLELYFKVPVPASAIAPEVVRQSHRLCGLCRRSQRGRSASGGGPSPVNLKAAGYTLRLTQR